jgi:hypothetical protein
MSTPNGGNAGSAASGTSNAGATDGGSAPPAASSTQPAGSQPSGTAADWTATLNEDQRGYVQLKGFKDPTMVVDSYRQLEKNLGVPKERLLKLPEKSDDVQAWGEVYNRLGRPAKPEEYKIPSSDPEFSKAAAGWFHQAGLTAKQAEVVATKLNEHQAAKADAQKKAFETKVEAETVQLKQKWGSAYEQNVATAKQAATTFGISGDMLDSIEGAIGFPATMELLNTIGGRLGEHGFIDGKSSTQSRILTPEAAKARIKELKTDHDFVQRYTKGDSEARQELERLHRQAYPETA